jgi:molybdopterin-containing oxidoreductase family iron-sulfur binding subunit
MKTNQKVWKGLEELNNTPEFEKQKHNEFPEKLPAVEEASNDLESMKAPRRDFLKMLGFSLTAATVASCQMPVKKVIPYLEKPGNVTPGVPNFYATTYAQAGEYASILVKNREGRPIKIEGNQLSSITKGTTSARMQAIILNLYDSTRLQTPMIKGIHLIIMLLMNKL